MRLLNESLPDASQPVSHQSEHADQQDQNSSPVLQVVVQFPGHPAQTQQADHLQGAEQAADALRGGRREKHGLLQVNAFCRIVSQSTFAETPQHVLLPWIVTVSKLSIKYSFKHTEKKISQQRSSF